MNLESNIDWGSILLKVVVAIIILLITWVLARVVVWAFGKLGAKVPALGGKGSDGESLAVTLGKIASLLVWLFGLIAILELFNLSEVLTPIQGLLSGVFNALPNIIGAIFVFVIGALLAKIVRQLIETSLGAVPFQKWFGRVGGEEATGNSNIARTIALVVYALIMIVVAIAALQILGISSISDPAQRMLQAIFDAIPRIIAAGIVLALGVVIAGFAANLLKDILEGLGTDRALRRLEVVPEDASAVPTITRVVQIGIVLFFAVMAAQLLNFPVITRFLAEVLALGGKVVFGAAIIAAGFFIANLLGRIVGGTAGDIVKWAAVVLFVAMGLTFMGIANDIIVLAFGALVVGAAVAGALAFGLGGRAAAGRLLERAQEHVDLSRGSGDAGAASTPAASTGSASAESASTESASTGSVSTEPTRPMTSGDGTSDAPGGSAT